MPYTVGDTTPSISQIVRSRRKETILSEKEEFEMPPAGMPKWITDHVELYLSEPEKAHLWDSTIGGGPGPLPTLLLIARGAKSGKLRPLPLLYQEMDGKYVVIGSKGGAPTHPGWYVNLRANPECEIPGGREAHARSRTDGRRRRTNARLEEDGGNVSAVRRIPEASWLAADPGGGSRTDWPGMKARLIEAARLLRSINF
jgi:deazaflavin-dependent oxidoreductase (nitroreductase family)